MAERFLHRGTSLFSHQTAFNFQSFCSCFHSWTVHNSQLLFHPAPLIAPPDSFRALAGVQYVAAQEFGRLGDPVLQHLSCTLEVSFLAINYYPHSWRNELWELEHLRVNETPSPLSGLFKQGGLPQSLPPGFLLPLPPPATSNGFQGPTPDVLRTCLKTLAWGLAGILISHRA